MPHTFCALRAHSECGSLLPLLKTLKTHVFQLFIESGSEQPHISESFALQKRCGINRDGGAPRRLKPQSMICRFMMTGMRVRGRACCRFGSSLSKSQVRQILEP